jgi:alpha-1,2-mannosyltransferase
MTARPGTQSLRWRLVGKRSVIAASWLFALSALGYLAYRGVIGPMRDLDVYRNAGLAVRQGRPLYAMVTSIGLPYTYPPIGAVLAVPLTLVPFQLAKLAWVAVMVCVPLGVATWFGFRPLLARISRAGQAGQADPPRTARPAGTAAAAAAFAAIIGCCALPFPVRQEFEFGQVDLFLVALCLLDCAAAKPRWPRGLLIGLATAIKLEPGVFMVYLLITGRRKDAAVAAISFAAWTALAYLVDPHDSVSYWTSEIFHTRRLGGPGSAGNQSLRGIILRAFNPHLAPPAVWLAVALIVAVAGFAAARACWRRGNDMAGITITGLLAAALSPVAWIHHYCWVIAAIGVIAGEGRSRPRLAAAVATFALFLTMLPVRAQTMINNGSLAVFPGRELEDAFGVAALALIVIMWRMRSTEGELRAWAPPHDGQRGGWPAPRSRPLPSSGSGAAEQLPSGTG